MHDTRPDRLPAIAAATRRSALRARILAALRATGGMRGAVRPRQRGLSRALEAADCGDLVTAARIVLAEVGR